MKFTLVVAALTGLLTVTRAEAQDGIFISCFDTCFGIFGLDCSDVCGDGSADETLDEVDDVDDVDDVIDVDGMWSIVVFQ